MKKRKLVLSRETIQMLSGSRTSEVAGGASRVRCGPGTYADSCLQSCQPGGCIYFETESCVICFTYSLAFTCPIFPV